jgi:hypothetical protein
LLEVVAADQLVEQADLDKLHLQDHPYIITIQTATGIEPGLSCIGKSLNNTVNISAMVTIYRDSKLALAFLGKCRTVSDSKIGLWICYLPLRQ